MTADGPTTTNASPTRKSGVGLCAVVLILIAGGIYAGMRWHDTFSRLLGLDAEVPSDGAGNTGKDAAGSKLWTCSMHPQVLQEHPGLCPVCHIQLAPLKVTPD